MSESTSVFIRTDKSFSDVKFALEKILNCQLVKVDNVEWELYSVSLIGLYLSLFEADDFEDDRELNLSEFNYSIDVYASRGMFDIDYESDWRQMFSTILGSMISINLNCECLIVDNMQTLVKRFLPQ